MHRFFNAGNRGLIHQLQAGRNDSRSNDRVDRAGGAVERIKFGKSGFRESRPRNKPKKRFGNQAKGSLGCCKQCIQVVAGHILDRLATGFQNSAVCKHYRQTQHVISGNPVFKAARTSRVAGDISADSGMTDARGIGGIEKTELFDFRLQIGGDDSGLSPDCRVAGINLQDSIHSSKTDDDSSGADWNGSGCKSRAHSTRNQWNARFGRRFHYFGSLLRRLWQNNNFRNAFGKGSIIAVDGQIFGRAKHSLLAGNPDEVINDSIFHPHPHRLHPTE